MGTETEIKLRLPDGADAARARLDRLGYQARGARTLEVDQLYDRPDGELRGSGRVLRLRSRGERWVLTYKGPPDDGPHKSREEIELAVEDGAAMEMVLLRLGYCAGFRYEKHRTIFELPDEPGIVTLDETPIGDFLELEGPGEWIDRTTVKLGFLTTDQVCSTYAALYRDCRKEYPSLPSNMVFTSSPTKQP